MVAYYYPYDDYRDEEAEEPKQPRCRSCGRFLPRHPTGEHERVEWDIVDYNPVTGDTKRELVNLGLVDEWACKCGAKWEIDEVYR